MKIDAGRYIVALEGISKRDSKAGNTMLVATLRVLIDNDKEQLDTVITDYVMLDSNKLRLLDFIKCFGYGEDTKQGLKVLLNKLGTITVTSNGYVIYLDTAQAAKEAGIDINALKTAYK